MKVTNMSKKRILIISVVFLVMEALVIHTGMLIGFQGGIVTGCQTLANTMIIQQFSPKCALRNSKLVVTVTNPVTGQVLILDAETGKPVEDQ